MGFNHAACGEQSVACFVNSMCQSECRQLLLSVRFIRGNKSMLAALQKKDWPTFARLYNGPAYAQNRYDDKLSKAYVSFCKYWLATSEKAFFDLLQQFCLPFTLHPYSCGQTHQKFLKFTMMTSWQPWLLSQSFTVRMYDVLRHGCRSGGVSLWRNVHESMLLTKQ